MPVNSEAYKNLSTELAGKRIQIVAVSKTKSVEDIKALYELGHRDFGENYVQELLEKQPQLPGDIRWHFIGHLQTNKVKHITTFIEMIHGADSLKLIKEINKQGARNNRKIKCLLQVHIAQEETKFGLNEQEVQELVLDFTNNEEYEYVQICGLMGMASFTASEQNIRKEFQFLRRLFDKVKENSFYHDDKFRVLSMGMSADYQVAVEEGSNMVRIGSLIFGERTYQ
jgi:PLP dependent protein